MITMTISFEPGKPIQVTGPLNDRMMCYAMIEMARDVIHAHVPPTIQLATPDQVEKLVS